MKKELIRFVVTAAVCFTGVFIYVNYKSTKVAYIDMSKVYNDFKLTKELDKKLKETNAMRKTILDSLALAAKMFESQAKMLKDNSEAIKNYELKKEEFILKQEQFSKDYENQSQEYNAQILKQINQYSDEYRVSKGIDILIGADGSGIVMAGNSKLDLSDDFVNFINSKNVK